MEHLEGFSDFILHRVVWFGCLAGFGLLWLTIKVSGGQKFKAADTLINDIKTNAFTFILLGSNIIFNVFLRIDSKVRAGNPTPCRFSATIIIV